ncbi:MAG: hypothetical protein AAB594_01760 [Patescibacteria group bacterium]
MKSGKEFKVFLKIFLETLPIFIGIYLSYQFWQKNYLLFILYLLISVGLILIHKDKSEFLIFTYGIFIGLIVEILGTQKSGYQSFANPDFAGIPIWLPLAWGYGFVAMKRIGFHLRHLK